MTASVETPALPDTAPEAAASPAPTVTPAQRADVEKTISKARAELEFASFDELMLKPRRTAYPKITVQGPDGEPVVRRLKYVALSPEEFDALVAAYPPTPTQREKGATWNAELFQPALIAAVCESPQLTLRQAKDLYTNANYAPGERQGLFFAALDVCGGGLDVPFTDGD